MLTQTSAATTLSAFAEHAQKENDACCPESRQLCQDSKVFSGAHLGQFRKRAMCPRQELSQN